MQFSIYYRIQNRDEFFEMFFKKFSKQMNENLSLEIRENYEDLMEILVKYILDENVDDLKLLLLKPNAKIARTFFDYLTLSNIKNKKKCEIIDRIDEIFLRGNNMIDFKSFLENKVEPIDLQKEVEKMPKLFLTEEDDPFGDDDGGGDEGGDPFGDDDGGDTPDGGSDDSEGGDAEGGDTEDNGENDELDLERT